MKAQLFNRLSRGGTFRFSADLESVFIEQLTSERRVVSYCEVQPVRCFEQNAGSRAETLDATNYAFAARRLVGLNLDRREKVVAIVTGPTKSPRIIR